MPLFCTRFDLFFLGLFVSGFLSAQVNTTYNLKRYSLEEGLPQSTILSLFEDSRGFLWVGTSGGGLSRFDGRRFTNYAANEGLDGVIVNAICEDKKGLMWIGTSWSGLCRFDGRLFKSLHNQKGQVLNGIQDILLDSQKRLIVATDKGLFRMNETEGYVAYTCKKESVGSLSRVILSSGNMLFASGENGIFRSGRGLELEKLVFENRIKPSKNSLCSDRNGDVYFADQRGGVWKIAQNAGNPLSPERIQVPDAADGQIGCLFVDSNNDLWVAIRDKGVYVRRPGGWIHLGVENGLPSGAINCILEDRNHCFWLGSNDQGVVRFYDQGITGFSGSDILQSGRIFGLASTGQGIIGGFIPKGAFQFDGNQVTPIKIATALPFTAIAFTRNPSGDLVFASEKEVFVLKAGRILRLPHPVIPEEALIRAIHYAKDGSLWIGTKYAGVYHCRDKKHEWFHPEKGNIESSSVYSIVEDEAGVIWFGSSAGILYKQGNKIVSVKNAGTICNAYAGSIEFDKLGNLWIATDRCVSLYKNNTFINLSDSGLAPKGPIYSLLIDSKGHVWVGTNTGIHQIICDERGNALRYNTFSMNEGFAGIECNSRALCRDSLDNIYVGTVKGLFKINSRERSYFANTQKPQLILEDVFLEQDEYDWNKYADSVSAYYGIPHSVRLPYMMNNLNVKTLYIDKWNAGEIQYSYKLDGWDQSWSEPFSGELAIYRNLSAGNYVFRARAKAKGQPWTYLSNPLKIAILKPFWKEVWFIGLCMVMLVLAAFVILKARQIRRKFERDKLETLILLRTQQIQKQKEEKEILLKEIHHRVKNNLQVVISLLNLQSSNVTDEKALDAFSVSKSRLRTIALIHEKLYRSRDFKNISLRDYIADLVNDLVESYSTDTKINLDLNLNLDALDLNTLVPLGLIMNEVITNSLKYAFEGQDQGTISISLGPWQNHSFLLEIGDNGRGYVWSDELSRKGCLGLELIRILAEQMDGKITHLNRPGTWYHVYFSRQKS